MTSIGWNINDLRVRAGLSQEELAEKIGKTRSAISQYESGKIIPRMGVIEDLAQVFGVPKNVIINGFSHEEVVSGDELELLRLYRLMDVDNRAKFLTLAGTFVVASEKNGERDRGDVERTWGFVKI